MPWKDKEKERAYRERTREQRKVTQRSYYLKNRDKALAKAKDWQLRNPDKVERIRRSQILRQYGVDQDWYDAMLLAQDDRCAICRTLFTRTPHVDHNHTTNKARALLCSGCNIAVGVIESSKYLECLKYLEEHADNDKSSEETG